MAVHEVKVKTDNKKETNEDTKELIDQFNKDVNKSKVPHHEDITNRKEIDAAALKLAEDPANADLNVTSHEEIAKVIQAKKRKVCWSCRLANCYNRQICSMKLKIKKRYQGKCTGKIITFKELKESKPSTPTATTQILPPASTDSDSDSEYLTEVFSGMKSPELEFGFRHCLAGFSTVRVVFEETVPNFEELKETEDIADKACIIFLSKLSKHMEQYHTIYFYGKEYDDPVSEWISSATAWDEEVETYSDSENEVIENSGAEQINQSDLELDIEFFPHLPPATIRERHSDSSSDSSSGKSSSSKSRKKSRKNRGVDRNSARIEAANQQNKARLIKYEAAQQKNLAQITEVLENQASLKSFCRSVQTDLKKMTDNQTDLKKMADAMVALSAQSNSSQETVKSIQAGTMKLVSESEIAKQNNFVFEQRMDMLAEQQRKENIPPIGFTYYR
jgi:hypothetical protein